MSLSTLNSKIQKSNYPMQKMRSETHYRHRGLMYLQEE